MMQAYVLEFRRASDEHIALIKFAYNNYYHSSIGMTSYEALYRQKCICFIYWNEEGEQALKGLKLVQKVMDKVKLIRDNLKVV